MSSGTASGNINSNEETRSNLQNIRWYGRVDNYSISHFIDELNFLLDDFTKLRNACSNMLLRIEELEREKEALRKLKQ